MISMYKIEVYEESGKREGGWCFFHVCVTVCCLIKGWESGVCVGEREREREREEI